MSFTTQALLYGWTALASLGELTGPTIYSFNPRNQIGAEDVIPLVLGTHERCLSTQLTTNPTYSINATPFVLTWRDTDGSLVSVTNSIGWHIERDMLADTDGKMKQLPPFFTATPPGRYTNDLPRMSTTGIFEMLQIGNYGPHITTNTNTMVVSTNWGSSFTRTPHWTNSIRTNWFVNYTSYWPSTNGQTTNVCYTSDYQQAVNYASSWTATGGHVWATASNWPNEIVVVSNVTTYGDWPWQAYVEDMQERYKFLNALSNHVRSVVVNGAEYRMRTSRTVTYTWENRAQGLVGGQYYVESGYSNLLNGLVAMKTPAEMVALAEPYWGAITNFSEQYDVYYLNVSLPWPWEDDDRLYYQKRYVTASTNAAVGASAAYKQYAYTSSGPSWGVSGWYEGQYPIYDAGQSASITLSAGTYFFHRSYSNDAGTPEWMHGELNSNKFVVVVSVSGAGGGLIPGEVTADGVSVGSWADLSSNQSPYTAASNVANSTLEISVGNLDIPTEAGTKNLYPSYGAALPYTIWFSEGGSGVFRPYFQDALGDWHEGYSYCTNKYW